VAYDDRGKPYSVRYEAANAMLLNEFLKEHHNAGEEDARMKIEDGELDQLELKVAQLQSELSGQAAELKGVSNRLDTRKSAMLDLASF